MVSVQCLFFYPALVQDRNFYPGRVARVDIFSEIWVRVRKHLIDFDQVRKVATEHKPKVIIAGGSAYSRIIDFKKFREIADEVGAYLMVDMAHFAGLVAGGVYPNPVEHAHVVTSTTHKTLRGPRGGLILSDDEEVAKMVDRKVFPGSQGGPLMHMIAAKAVAFGEALQPEFKIYIKSVLETNHLIEEFMLLANVSVGKKILSNQ